MSSNPRDRLAEILRPLIPETWGIEKHTVKTVGTLSKPTVFLDYAGLRPLEEAPLGNLVYELEATVVSHLTDYGKAEEMLDPGALTLARSLDSSTEVSWSRADKRQVQESYLGWVFTIQLISPIPEPEA
jgi:hypothetical protein